ncbi:uncharacterized protein LOC112490878 [Ziziphus jujuba]|uniref:Uncharacterized protein LOC112490878 n=1 Tax=Ziziphus jujuba TaxID=326968 RepID=A0ABM4AGD1_ZIZJJ|nr:uncharacterized protein LOC112490878 [Ziziphus jujuba]
MPILPTSEGFWPFLAKFSVLFPKFEHPEADGGLRLPRFELVAYEEGEIGSGFQQKIWPPPTTLRLMKEVKSVVPLWALDHKNNQDRTPSEIFTQNHKELVEGEKWMKDTATSCTVVGALIFTVMFAAAFTVPGGNEDSGSPVFLANKCFDVFGNTSRYPEEDFPQSLPRKLMFGLFTLFVSIVSMMVALSATFYIVVIDRCSWIFFPVIVFAFFPGAIFAIIQLRLPVEIGRYTYGGGIFDKKARI